MEAATHLKSLQALDMVLRTGALKDAATALGITPAAVGQRIRSLESYLGVDLLMRGRSGLRPTPELERALPDLHAAFAALDRVTRELDFQRVTEIHIVADPDLAELWLAPRLSGFRSDNPNIHFNINGEGDVPIRIGASDIHIGKHDIEGDLLFHDVCVPACTHENLLRLERHPPEAPLEGYPLLQLERRDGAAVAPEWSEWVARYGMRVEGLDRGYRYRNARLLIEAARGGVGMALAPLSLMRADIEAGALFLPFPEMVVPALAAYRIRLRDRAAERPQIRRFLAWLRTEARAEAARLPAVASAQSAS